MKTLLSIVMLLLISLSLAAKDQKAAEKIYSQNEFDKKLQDVLAKKLKHMGKGKIVEFSKELLDKEKEIRLKEMAVEKKEEQLQVSIKDFKKKVKEFQERQNKLIACMDDVEKQESKRVGHMVDTISNMRPQNAAKVLSVQDSDISVKILAKLPSEKVAKIFNFMDKEISARLQKQYLTMKK